MTIEYGSEGLVSTRCDVYSYGIMLMEVFSGKKPNSQMFHGNITLQSWVKESLPDRVIDVIDSNLVAPNEEIFSDKMKCLSSIMELALSCSVNSPSQRINMKDVLVALQKIKRQFLQTNNVSDYEIYIYLIIFCLLTFKIVFFS